MSTKIGTNVTFRSVEQVGSNVTIGDNCNFGVNVAIGNNVTIGNGVTVGNNVTIGNNTVILNDVSIGDDTRIEHFVLLKTGTAIGDNCYVDSYVKSSGENSVGNNVTLRFNSTIARKVTIEDDVFISPNVMTIFSQPDGSKSSGTKICKGAFIGTASVLNPSITVGPGAVIGAMALVTKDCEAGATYIGVPAKKWSK